MYIGALVATMVLTVVSFGISSGPATASSSSAYTIGFSDGLTGELAAYAPTELLWLRAVVAATNATGGVNGHKVKIVVLNQGNIGSGEATANVIQLATQDHVSAIEGMIASSDCDSVLATVDRYQTPVLCQTASVGDLQPVNKYVFVDTSVEASEALPDVNFIKKITGDSAPKIAALVTDTPGGDLLETKLGTVATSQGASLVSSQQMPFTATSVSSYVAAIVAAHPSAVVAEVLTQFVQPLVTGLKAAGLNIPVITATNSLPYSVEQSVASPQLYSTNNAAPFLPAQPGLNAGEKALAKAFAKLGAKSATVINAGSGSQDAVGPYAIISALKICGFPCTGPKMAAALQKVKISVPGLVPAGSYGYTAQRHVGAQVFSYYHWNTAKKEPVLASTAKAGAYS